eukprot:1157950-Pelagomonas_calceolata.AAC.5
MFAMLCPLPGSLPRLQALLAALAAHTLSDADSVQVSLFALLPARLQHVNLVVRAMFRWREQAWCLPCLGDMSKLVTCHVQMTWVSLVLSMPRLCEQA